MTDEAREPVPQQAGRFDGLDASVQEALVWKNLEFVPSRDIGKAQITGETSFFISNRTVWSQTQDNPDGLHRDETYPLGDDDPTSPAFTANWYVSNASSNDTNPANYLVDAPITATTPPPSFVDAVVTALEAKVAAGGAPSLAIFIHGVGALFSDAVASTATFGAKLTTLGGYDGLVIGFDWPSFGSIMSAIRYASLPYSFPPTATRGRTRDNVAGSVAAFSYMLDFVRGVVQRVPGTQTSLICHSEGNYMGMLGLHATAGCFDHVVLLAPDINDGALLSTTSGGAGQGEGICASAGDVTVYWTTSDRIISDAQRFFKKYHNPEYPDRLGLSGCHGGPSDQNRNVYSVDCSGVLTEENVKKWAKKGVIPHHDDSAAEIHLSYLYVPQVLSDITSVLNGTLQSQIANRRPVAGSDRWFTMTLEAPPPEDARVRAT